MIISMKYPLDRIVVSILLVIFTGIFNLFLPELYGSSLGFFQPVGYDAEGFLLFGIFVMSMLTGVPTVLLSLITIMIFERSNIRGIFAQRDYLVYAGCYVFYLFLIHLFFVFDLGPRITEMLL